MGTLSIKYCEGCGKKITPDDLLNDNAVLIDNLCYCKNCKPENVEEDFEEEAPVVKKRPQKSVLQTARNVREKGSTNRQPRKKSGDAPPIDPKLLVAGVGGLAVILIVLLVLVLKQSEGNKKKTTKITFGNNPTAQSTEPRGKKKFLEAVQYADKRLGEYATLIQHWEQVSKELAETSYADQVQKKIQEVRNQLDREAQRTFDSFKRKSDELCRQGDHPTALSEWKNFPSQLLVNPWVDKVEQEKLYVEQAHKKILAEREAARKAAESQPVRPVQPPVATPSNLQNAPKTADGWIILYQGKQSWPYQAKPAVGKAGGALSFKGTEVLFYFEDLMVENFTLKMDIQIQSGAMLFNFRKAIPMVLVGAEKIEAPIALLNKQWYQIQIECKDNVMRYWRSTKESPLIEQPIPPNVRSGPIMLMLRPEFLFRMEQNHLQSLKQKALTPELRAEFSQRGLPLAEDAAIEAHPSGTQWRIVEKDKVRYQILFGMVAANTSQISVFKASGRVLIDNVLLKVY